MIAPPSNLNELPPASGKVQRALLSVFDKNGIVDLGRKLQELGVEILSSGGTAKKLTEAGIKVTSVDEFTGANEVLGGRVKTLHPKIHAGILADRRQESHLTDLNKNDYHPIDLVVCSLYPFQETLASGADYATMIENIDIGGPTMIRAAAKNADGGVSVALSPADYPALIDQLSGDGCVALEFRRKLAAKAFRTIASYDLAIASWAERAMEPAGSELDPLPTALSGFQRKSSLRYGENPHQPAALYSSEVETGGIANGTLLCGKALSYNNYLDMDAAYNAVLGVSASACSIVKHTNTCGLAQHESQAEAFKRAFAGDPISAFGSILGFNRPLELETAQAIRETKLFVECIVAPGFEPKCLEEFGARKNLRLFEVERKSTPQGYHAHRISGGMLAEVNDSGILNPAQWECVTETKLKEGWLEELAFAMHAVAKLKSNAIAITKNLALLGCGAGQMSRVDACEQAIKKAGQSTQGAFLASDAFFPFDDCAKLAGEAGIVAIVQPGGSKRDPEVIEACNALGIAMVFTGRRHFCH